MLQEKDNASDKDQDDPKVEDDEVVVDKGVQPDNRFAALSFSSDSEEDSNVKMLDTSKARSKTQHCKDLKAQKRRKP